jgi:hypothetical protein
VAACGIGPEADAGARARRPACAALVNTSFVAKGYAEGPAAEEAEARRDALERGELEEEAPVERPAVYGSTADEPERHFLGWLDDVDPDQLFVSGKAWGITVMRRSGAA